MVPESITNELQNTKKAMRGNMEGMEERHPEKREEKHQSSSNLGRLQGNMTLRTNKEIRQMLGSFFLLFEFVFFLSFLPVGRGFIWKKMVC